MAMNREQKRMLQRQGEVDADGTPVRQKKRPATPPPARDKSERTGFVQFFREVREELRKVAWPTRAETINYSIIVLVTVVLLTTLIFGVDLFFARAVLRLFES
jgi:preprotein translocase subunit SecE